MSPALLMVTPSFPPEGGGLERYARTIGSLLATEHGWRVAVATTGERAGPGRRHLVRERRGDLDVWRLPYQWQVSNTRLGISWARDLRLVLDEVAPDLINAHAPVPGLADVAGAVAGHIPFVLTYHTASMHKGRWPVDGAIAAYERLGLPRTLRRAAAVLTSSEYVRAWAPLARAAARGTPVVAITPGVDPTRFHPAPEPRRNRILFAGQFGKAYGHKGVDDLLQATALLAPRRPELLVDLVGESDDLPRLQALVAALRIEGHVRFRGRLPGPEMAEAYREATVLALPTRIDSFPMVLLEAMASGVPVVTTPVGGIPEFVSDGVNGFLVPPGDSAALAERLAALVDDPALAARLGAEGRLLAASSFTWSRQAERTHESLTRLLAAAPTP